MDRESALVVVGLIANLVLLGQILVVVLALFFFLRNQAKKNKSVKNIAHILSEYGLIFAFFVALIATSGSLFFSEFAHFAPCKLCWYQRIIMYPQVLLLGIASLKNDFAIRRYVLPLSLIGIGIAIYHYALQMSPIPLPCSDEVANCALKQVAYYGYITIPLMSATAFALILLFVWNTRRK